MNVVIPMAPWRTLAQGSYTILIIYKCDISGTTEKHLFQNLFSNLFQFISTKHIQIESAELGETPKIYFQISNKMGNYCHENRHFHCMTLPMVIKRIKISIEFKPILFEMLVNYPSNQKYSQFPFSDHLENGVFCRFQSTVRRRKPRTPGQEGENARRTVVGKGTKTAKTPENVHFVQINRKNYGFICFWALRVDLDYSLNRTNNPY